MSAVAAERIRLGLKVYVCPAISMALKMGAPDIAQSVCDTTCCAVISDSFPRLVKIGFS